MREHLAARPEHHAVAVEDQLVLPAHRVDIGDERAVVGGALRDHLLPLHALACVVRRAVDVDQDLGAMVGLPCHRARRVPAVFADADRDPDACDLEDRAAVTDREVALLVEDAVVGQEDLVIDRLQLFVVDEGRGVEDLAVVVDKTDHRRDSRRGGDHRLELLQVVAYEAGLEDQVLRWVAARGSTPRRRPFRAPP